MRHFLRVTFFIVLFVLFLIILINSEEIYLGIEIVYILRIMITMDNI